MNITPYRFIVLLSQVLALLLLMLGMGLAADEKAKALCPPPLPGDGLHQVAPDPKLSPEVRSFYGSWQGRWGSPGTDPENAVPTILVVEQIISPDKVMVVLGWGSCPHCQAEASCQRFWGKIDLVQGKHVLYFGYPGSKTFSFALDGDRLIGGDGTEQVIMRRLG